MRTLNHPGAVSQIVPFRLADGSPRLIASSRSAVLAWDPLTRQRTAQFNLRTIYLRQGDTNRAEVVWQKAGDLDDPDAVVRLA